MAILRIFIPSFKREESLKSLLNFALADKIYEQAHIHVTDDGVCGWSFLKEMESDGFISTTFHEKNIGYAKTLLEAINQCNEEYIVLINDDDKIIREGVYEINERLSGIDFISTNYSNINGQTIRGGASCEVMLSNSRSYSQHAPGLIFKTASAHTLLEFLGNKLNQGCKFTFTYPQVALLWGILLLGGRARHENISIAKEGTFSPSQLLTSGRPYWHPVARLEQKLAAIELLCDFQKYFDTGREQIRSLIDLEKKSLGYIIYDSLRNYDHDLSKKFARSVIKERLREFINPKK